MEIIRSFAEPLKSDGNTITGYPILFDTPTEVTEVVEYKGRQVLKTFMEVVRASAVTRSLTNGKKIPLVKQHDKNGTPIASFPRGKMRLTPDQKGLYLEAPADHRPDIKQAIEDDCLSEWSFRAIPAPNGVRWSADGKVRELVDLLLLDVSLVHQGHYPGTEAVLRKAKPEFHKVANAQKRKLHLAKIRTNNTN